ncbi:hypothetical protein BT69DRAFT_1330036 [Atractiella rhizophila]|nr:hypothetical protein BT69DRAFT_1330036 [Atractiella rhizophila]
MRPMRDFGLPDANLTLKHEPMKALDQSRAFWSPALWGHPGAPAHAAPKCKADHALKLIREIIHQPPSTQASSPSSSQQNMSSSSSELSPSDLGAFVLPPGYLYCRNHQVYVHPEAKEKHFTQKSHKLAGHTKKHIARAIRRLPEPIEPPERYLTGTLQPAPPEPLPSLPVQHGYHCHHGDCLQLFLSHSAVRDHRQAHHRDVDEPRSTSAHRCHVQLVYHHHLGSKGNQKIIAHVQPPETSQQQARTEPPVPTLAQVSYSEARPEHLAEGQQSRRSLFNILLHWDSHLSDQGILHERSLIQKSVRSPVGDKDRPELARLFQHLKDNVEGWHQNIWKHGSGRIGERLMEHRAGVDRLKNFGRKLEPGTYAKYAATFGRFISFILHCTRKRAGQRHKYGYPEMEEDIEAKADALYRHIEGLGEGSPPEDEPLLDLCQAIFKPRATKDPRTDLAVEFLMRTSMSPQGTWGGDDRVTQPVSHLQFWIRLVAFRIYERESAKLPRDGSADRPGQDARHPHGPRRLAGHLDFRWLDEEKKRCQYQGIEFDLDHMRSVFREPLRRTRNELRQGLLQDLPLDYGLLRSPNLRDELGKRDLGYNFLQDPKNGLSEHFLDFFTKMTPEVKKKMHDASSGRWKTAETEKTEEHLLGEGLRNIFWAKDTIAFVMRYNKSQAQTGRIHRVARLVDPEVAGLLLEYLVWVRPAEIFFASLRPNGERHASAKRQHLFGGMDQIRITTAVNRELKKTSDLAGPGYVPPTFQQLRQILIGWEEAHLRHLMPTPVQETSTMESQAGHPGAVAHSEYARSAAKHTFLRVDIFDSFHASSKLHWQLMCDVSLSSHVNPLTSILDPAKGSAREGARLQPEDPL